MNELIKVTDGVALLAIETATKIAEMERTLKEIKEAEDALRTAILNEMESKGIKKIETDVLSITYKDGYDKETFQSKNFRADHPDMWDEYIKMSPVKSSIMIKLKEDKS